MKPAGRWKVVIWEFDKIVTKIIREVRSEAFVVRKMVFLRFLVIFLILTYNFSYVKIFSTKLKGKMNENKIKP